jgi:hypothetical protein
MGNYNGGAQPLCFLGRDGRRFICMQGRYVNENTVFEIRKQIEVINKCVKNAEYLKV